jgi:hypothetical protein
MPPRFSKRKPMNKLSMPNMMDSLDFVKKLWGSMGLPNAVAPTADLDELDKRIADLKAVEQWLQLNASMLRGTIQGLEVQRGTIATLKAFGTSFANLKMPGMPGQAGATAGSSSPFAAPAPAAFEPPSAPPSPAPAEPERARTAAPPAAALPGAESGLSPTMWWNMLSDQFTKIAQAAASSASQVQQERAKARKTAAADPASAPAGKKTAKPAAKKTAPRKSAARKAAAKTAKGNGES